MSKARLHRDTIRRIQRTVKRIESQPPKGIRLQAAMFQKFAFTLLEDAASGTPYGKAWARISMLDGSDVLIPVAEFRYKWGILDGARAGYEADCTPFAEAFYFDQGPCVTKCPTAGSFPGLAAQTGTVGTELPAVTASGTDVVAGTWLATGLPPGLSMDTAGEITGTPTEAGTFYVPITVQAQRTGEAVGVNCTLTKLTIFTIAAP